MNRQIIKAATQCNEVTLALALEKDLQWLDRISYRTRLPKPVSACDEITRAYDCDAYLTDEPYCNGDCFNCSGAM